MAGEGHVSASPKALENYGKDIFWEEEYITSPENKKELYGLPEDGRQRGMN